MNFDPPLQWVEKLSTVRGGGGGGGENNDSLGNYVRLLGNLPQQKSRGLLKRIHVCMVLFTNIFAEIYSKCR